MNSMPTFPDLLPSTTFSFTSAYSHQTQHVPTSSTPRRQRSNSANRRRPTRRESDQNHSNPENPTNGAYNGARRDDSRHAQANGQAVTRARTRRILLGERPVGTQLTRESEELSDQEEAVYHAEMGVRNFGHAFLLPPGRRQTQTEQDYPPSPTPSDAPEQEHRQEDQADSPNGVGGGVEVDVEVEAAAEDLDGEVEDRDNSGGSEEQDETMEE